MLRLSHHYDSSLTAFMLTPISISKPGNLLVQDPKTGVASMKRQSMTQKFSKSALKASIRQSPLDLLALKSTTSVKFPKQELPKQNEQTTRWNQLRGMITIYHYLALRSRLNPKRTRYKQTANLPVSVRNESQIRKKCLRIWRKNSCQTELFKAKSFSKAKDCLE